MNIWFIFYISSVSYIGVTVSLWKIFMLLVKFTPTYSLSLCITVPVPCIAMLLMFEHSIFISHVCCTCGISFFFYLVFRIFYIICKHWQFDFLNSNLEVFNSFSCLIALGRTPVLYWINIRIDFTAATRLLVPSLKFFSLSCFQAAGICSALSWRWGKGWWRQSHSC